MFLRITDGRKYCYYSFYVWSCTFGMALLAVFAHFTLDTDTINTAKAPSPIAQGALGKQIVKYILVNSYNIKITIAFNYVTYFTRELALGITCGYLSLRIVTK